MPDAGQMPPFLDPILSGGEDSTNRYLSGMNTGNACRNAP